MHSLKRITLSGALALGLTACPGGDAREIDAKETALTLSQNSEALAKGVGDSLKFLGESATVRRANEVCTTTGDVTHCVEQPVAFDEPALEGADWLKKSVFIEENIDEEQTTATAAFFCLKPARFCAPPEGGTVNAECERTLTEVPLCAKVESFAEGEFEIALLVGKQQLNPLNFSLKPKYLKVEARFADLRGALEAWFAAMNEPLPEGFPTRLEGRVAFELTQVSDRVLTLEAGVLDAFALDLFAAGHRDHVEVRVAAAPELWSVKVDGDAKQIDAQADMKGLDLLVAADSIWGQGAEPCYQGDTSCPPPPAAIPGEALFHLDGASFKTLFDAATAEETLAFKGIGLGDGTSKLQYRNGGATSDLVKLDLNASLGRRVDVTIVQKADGAQIKVSPGFALLLDHDFRALAAQASHLKGAALKAITEIKLAGTDPSVLIRKVQGDLKVEAGTLELHATGMPEGFADIHLTATPNQCLAENTSVVLPEGSHPFAAALAGTCAQ